MSKVMTAQSTNPMPRPLWLSVMVDATLVAVALFVYWIRGRLSVGFERLGSLPLALRLSTEPARERIIAAARNGRVTRGCASHECSARVEEIASAAHRRLDDVAVVAARADLRRSNVTLLDPLAYVLDLRIVRERAGSLAMLGEGFHAFVCTASVVRGGRGAAARQRDGNGGTHGEEETRHAD